MLKVSYVDKAPKGKDVSQLMGPFRKTSGLFIARAWLATEAAPFIIYEDGIPIGNAYSLQNDPDRELTANGKRWQYFEFTPDSDPNTNGRRYWAVPSDAVHPLATTATPTLTAIIIGR
jgi:hypothetical protein